MKHFYKVEETTATGGTGSLVLLGATLGNRPFSIVPADEYVPYEIDASDGSWEAGVGQVLAGNQLARVVVFQSSNNDLPVSLPLGTHVVRIGPAPPVRQYSRGAKVSFLAGQVVAAAGGYMEPNFDVTYHDSDNCIVGVDQLSPPDWCHEFIVQAQLNVSAPVMPNGAIKAAFAFTGTESITRVTSQYSAWPWFPDTPSPESRILLPVVPFVRAGATRPVVRVGLENLTDQDVTVKSGQFMIKAIR